MPTITEQSNRTMEKVAVFSSHWGTFKSFLLVFKNISDNAVFFQCHARYGKDLKILFQCFSISVYLLVDVVVLMKETFCFTCQFISSVFHLRRRSYSKYLFNFCTIV